jgi:hypothetical protein
MKKFLWILILILAIIIFHLSFSNIKLRKTVEQPQVPPHSYYEYHEIDCTGKQVLEVKNLQYGELAILNTPEIYIAVVEYLDTASWWEFGYKLKIVNKCDRSLTVTFNNSSVAGIRCEPVFFVDHIEPGHTRYFNLAWDRASLERSWIPYLDNIEFLLQVYYSSSWSNPAKYGTRVLLKN